MDPVRPRVLVVDDDARVAETMRRVLARAYDVTVETSAATALLRTATDAFDAVFCDLAMPGMTGMEFCAELSRSAPALAHRVVLTTGGAFTPQAEDFLASAPNPRLDKPFRAADLLAAAAAAAAPSPTVAAGL